MTQLQALRLFLRFNPSLSVIQGRVDWLHGPAAFRPSLQTLADFRALLGLTHD